MRRIGPKNEAHQGQGIHANGLKQACTVGGEHRMIRLRNVEGHVARKRS